MANKTKGATAGMTKREAVKRAIGDLGKDAKASQLQGHIRSKFGIEMTRGHVAVDRRKVLLKESAKAAPAAPKTAVQTVAGKAGPKKAMAAGITKKEAVRRALGELGPDAGPTQIGQHVKQRFGIGMSANHISDYKGKILRKEAKATKPPAQASAAGKTEPKSAAPQPEAEKAAAPPANGDAIGLEDIETVKDLVERVGAPDLRQLGQYGTAPTK